jgi:branched-subunit amino acid transport protein
MEIRTEFILILIGTALVTLLPRVVPLVLLSRGELPNWFLRFLNHVPVAVMAALLANVLLTSNEEWIPLVQNLKLIALIPTLIVAIITKSLLGTVVIGIISMMAVEFLF